MNPTTIPRQMVFTVDEAATLLRVSRWTVYKLVRGGTLPAARVGKRLLMIRRGALEELMGGQIDEYPDGEVRERVARTA